MPTWWYHTVHKVHKAQHQGLLLVLGQCNLAQAWVCHVTFMSAKSTTQHSAVALCHAYSNLKQRAPVQHGSFRNRVCCCWLVSSQALWGCSTC
jgi:hypothetical protein